MRLEEIIRKEIERFEKGEIDGRTFKLPEFPFRR